MKYWEISDMLIVCKQLIDIISSLPGIEINSYNLQYPLNQIISGWNGIYIFFQSDEKEPEGLFFLTRCLDKRYWEYGHLWRIELSVGDAMQSNGSRPITYNIFRPLIEEDRNNELDINREIKSLIDNLHYHFHHDGFMNGFNMNRSKYKLKEWQREQKIDKLLNIK
jgi:hypothetical protein